jgi:hypothetical protein
MLAIYGIIRLITGSTSLANTNYIPILSQSFLERLANIPAIIFYYLKVFFFPKDMAVYQLWIVSKINVQNFYLPLFLDLLFFISVALIGFYLYKKSRKIFVVFGFFFVWFLSGILMHLQIFPLDMTVADRWFYFPIIGMLGMGGVFAQSLNISSKKIKDIGYLVAFIVLIILSLRTIARNTNWFDEITLFEHDSKISTNSDLEANLGADYYLIKDYPNAIIHTKKSLELSPNERGYYNLGKIYLTTGDMKNAIYFYKKSLNTNFYNERIHKTIIVHVYEDFALISLDSDAPNISEKTIKTFLDMFPDSPILWKFLALDDYKINKKQEALVAIDKAKTLLPADTDINNLYQVILNNQPLNQ